MEQQWQPLLRSNTPLTSSVQMDELTAQLIEPFDYGSDGVVDFYPYLPPEDLPKDFNIGVIVGASGSGKSVLLRRISDVQENILWYKDKSVASHFKSPDDALQRLTASGLMSVPDWVKSYDSLSNGQQFRANLARQIGDLAGIDEFSSVVDRNVAKSASTSISRYIRQHNIKGVVLATVHRDVLEFLEPDWVIDTDRGEWTSGRWLQRPQLVLDIYPCSNEVWSYFSPHHYLSESLNKAAHCYLAVWEGQVVGFSSVLAYPSGTVKEAFREHRLVIHPDYQGFGFGHSLSEAVAQHYLDNGKRFFSKTSHPRLGEYRDQSSLWKATSKNHMKRTDAASSKNSRWELNPNRWSYSHEYTGMV